MEVLHTISDTRARVKEAKKAGKTVGFVPTMGALHAGHISLIEKCRAENDLVVCSIFVNPTQFDNPEDLKKYPRTLEADCELLETASCDVVFAPSADEMYVHLPQITLDFGNLEEVMEGRFRKGHFNGVGIVVSKLFHIVQPDRAYFGMKDLQQVAVLNRLVKDLSFDVELIPCPTKRESDGLAMSSRNTRLSPEARKQAPAVYQLLKNCQDLLLAGKSTAEVQPFIQEYLKQRPEFSLEYLEIANFENLQPIDKKMTEEGQTAICIAIFLDGVRLIDNIVF